MKMAVVDWKGIFKGWLLGKSGLKRCSKSEPIMPEEIIGKG